MDACKVFAAWVGAATDNEAAVAYDKVCQCHIRPEDVAHQLPDGTWETNYGNLRFEFEVDENIPIW